MTKGELITAIHEAENIPRKTVERVVNRLCNTITDQLALGDTVSLPGFGRFIAFERAPRTARNPQTGKTFRIPAGTTPKFRPGKTLRDALGTDASAA